jgi:hypothetical protein
MRREDGRIVGGEGWQEKVRNRNGRSWERQEIVECCTYQWNEWFLIRRINQRGTLYSIYLLFIKYSSQMAVISNESETPRSFQHYVITGICSLIPSLGVKIIHLADRTDLFKISNLV